MILRKLPRFLEWKGIHEAEMLCAVLIECTTPTPCLGGVEEFKRSLFNKTVCSRYKLFLHLMNLQAHDMLMEAKDLQGDERELKAKEAVKLLLEIPQAIAISPITKVLFYCHQYKASFYCEVAVAYCYWSMFHMYFGIIC